MLDEGEFELVMDEFILGLPPPTPSPPLSGVSSAAAHTVADFIASVGCDTFVTTERFTLDNVLDWAATEELRAALFRIYGRACVWPVPVEESKLVRTVTSERKPSRKPSAGKKAAAKGKKK